MKAQPRPIKWRIDPKELNPGPYCTICEVHRRLWRLIEQAVQPEDPITAAKMFSLVAEAYDCGVRMDKKLQEYVGAKDHHTAIGLDPVRPDDTYKEFQSK